MYSNHVKYSRLYVRLFYVKLSNWCFSAKIDSLMLTMHKTRVTDWMTYVQTVMQPYFVDPFKASTS